MNRGKGQVKTLLGGYTIVETMIFLAVSSAMFVAAMLLIGGQQNKAEFVNAVRDFETRITDISTNVSTGYYSNKGNFTCTTSPSGPSITAGAAGVGTNGDCMFVGVVVKLGNGGSLDQYATIPVAGLRISNTTRADASSLADTMPTPVTQAEESINFQYGTTIGCVAVSPQTTCNANSSANNAAIGFFTPLKDVTGRITQSGALQNQILVYPSAHNNDPVTGSNAATDGSNGAIKAYPYPGPGPLTSPAKIGICLLSGTTNQHAWIYIGAQEGNFAAYSVIADGSVCS